MNILTVLIPTIGLLIGSFMNLCIDRLPRHQSINPLHILCPFCNNPTKIYTRIPILGYLFSIGKCTQCDAPLSLRYPFIELAAAFILYILFRKYGFTAEFFATSFFIIFLILTSFIDLIYRTIPDELTISGLLIGFIFAFFRKPLFFYQDALYGIFACGGILFLIAYCCQKVLNKDILEFGDIALLAVIGAFCGLKGALFTLVVGSLFGVVIGLPIMFVKGENARYTIPFGPFLSLGALFYLTFGDRFINGFFRLISGG
jgi:leader peptidase (prepilin peptidase) / N-methyltransferase